MYNVVATGSSGNAVIYHKTILVDCGVPFALLKPFIRDLQIILLTHSHGDHINENTLRRIALERPTLRIGCCSWMRQYLTGIKNVDIYEIGQLYNYGSFSLSPIKLYHDVANCGYRIFKGETKILHATDTAHLKGITAKGYDLYALEHNYDEETIIENIEQKQLAGKFAYERGAMNSHLSEQAAREFIFNNKAEHSQVLRLHESNNNL